MKIAYFTDTFLPQVNGIATSLANQAKELGNKGHQIIIFTPKLDDIPREKFQAKNVTVIDLPTVPALVYTEYKLGIFGLPRVLKNLIDFDPDIIHLHSHFTVGMDAIAAAKILKKPLVGSLHVYTGNSDYMQWIKSKLAVKVISAATTRYLHFYYGQCDLVISPSKLFAKELTSQKFKKPVVSIPNAVDLEKKKILSAKEIALLKEKNHLKEKVILHFGRLSYEKKTDQVIKAFAILKKKHNNVSLFIIGDGPATDSLKRLTRKLKIEKDVVFTGFIDHPYLLSSGILSLGDLFITASNAENQPMVVLEAMLFGLPIIGVSQAGLKELVQDNGFLVKPGDTKAMARKMEEVLTNQKLKQKLSQKSLEEIKNYSIQTTVKKLLLIYKELIVKFKKQAEEDPF